MMKAHDRVGERGSALLIVFVFAAMVAIMLYTEMPVAVFEARRQKEQLLIDRGNEYVRAVRLFLRANRNQYPPNIEALEKTNQVRYLRNRYKDPFTGKDDWRLLHAGPNGMLVDSKVQQSPVAGAVAAANGGTGNQTGSGIGAFGAGNNAGGLNASGGNTVSSAANASIAGFGAPGANNNNAGGAVSPQGGFGNNRAATPAASTFGGFFSQPTNTASSTTGPDGQATANAKGDNPFSAAAQRAPTAVANTGAAATGSATGPDGQTLDDGGQPSAALPRNGRTAATGSGPGNDAAPGGPSTGMPDNSAVGPNGLASNPQYTGSGPSAPSVSRGVSAPNAPGGAGAFGTGGGNFGRPNSSMGSLQNANLAGVASKADGLSIKAINDQEKYQLWEFFYDPTKDPMRGAAGVAGGGTNNAGNNNANRTQSAGQGTGGFGGFNSTGIGAGNRSSGNNSGWFGNSTVNTSSQAPSVNPSNQTMSTSSNPR